MDSFLTMERFLKMRGHLITPLFSTLPLDHDFNFSKNQNDPLNTLSTEIEYVRRNLKQIGDEAKISRLCRIVNYALYIHAVDLGDIIDEKTFISHNLYHNLISIYITHQNVSQIDREKYLDLCRNNQGIMLASDTLRRFERILDKEGFDSKTFNLSAIFLVLFWANLERLKKILRNKALKNFNEAEKSGIALFDIEVIQMVKDCTECHMLIHYIGRFFIQNDSAEMKYSILN